MPVFLGSREPLRRLLVSVGRSDKKARHYLSTTFVMDFLANPSAHPLLNWGPITMLNLTLDWMHCKYLGSDKYLYGGVLHVIMYKLLTGTAQANMVQTWNNLKNIYADLDIKARYRVLKLTMFKRNKSGFPELRGRATEIKHLSKPLLVLWECCRTEGDRLHDLIYTALKASSKLDEILDSHRGEYNLPREASQEFIKYALQYCQACNALYNWDDDKLFNVTYKHHALLHLAFGSAYESPRLGWCWMGEDFMRLTRHLISSCMKGTRLEDVNRKSAKQFLRAMDVTNP